MGNDGQNRNSPRREKEKTPRHQGVSNERATRFELATLTLAKKVLRQFLKLPRETHFRRSLAVQAIRTRDFARLFLRRVWTGYGRAFESFVSRAQRPSVVESDVDVVGVVVVGETPGHLDVGERVTQLGRTERLSQGGELNHHCPGGQVQRAHRFPIDE
ncbi:MAG: hypothetical protein QOG54_1397 [Actinomycetota bacterium]|nr:hypothetical protein [Actinomycetota bacterium]